MGDTSLRPFIEHGTSVNYKQEEEIKYDNFDISKKCYKCKKIGHDKRECKEKNKLTLFERSDESIFQYPIIITECTFLLPEDKFRADKELHIHWDDLKKIIIEHPENKFVLIHFSKRYKSEFLKEFFSKIDIPNIIPWI